MKIIVLAGGLSPERDVSLTSGSLIANSLIKSGYEVMLLDLYLGTNNKEIPAEYKNKNSKELYSYKISKKEPNLEKIKQENPNKDILIGENALELCMQSDLVFMALHGGVGENGKLQALFDIYNINYTGSSSEGSMLAMDKDLSKKIVKEKGVLTANWNTFKSNEINKENIKIPCVVKPLKGGSSIGISIVNTKKELKKALNLAKKWEEELLVEDLIKGREFSIGILNNEALPVIEIIPKTDFYNYQNKYQNGNTIEICPANITKKEEKYLKENALKAHKSLKLGYYSRIDFILDDKGKAYFLEANTLPGMTPNSLLPQEAKEKGMTYDELCKNIVLSKIKSS